MNTENVDTLNAAETQNIETNSEPMELPKQTLENGDTVATIKTNTGTIRVKLYTDQVPITTTNFIGLAKQWYYDGVTFHRVIPNFMIQWGDPDGTGMGGESIYGWSFEDEFVEWLWNGTGTISMANSGPDSNGSQFFINTVDNSLLNNKHSVFWVVVEGFEVAEKISKAKTWENDKPEKEIKMINVTIDTYNNGKYSSYDFDKKAALQKVETIRQENIEKEKELQQQQEKLSEEKLKKDKDREAKDGDQVSVNYIGTTWDWEEFDNSYTRGQPLQFTVGEPWLLPGFQNAVKWLKPGEKKKVTIPAAEAYGKYDETITEEVPLAVLKENGFDPKEWEMLETVMWEVKVLKVEGETVTVDGNHPLASKDLTFEVELVEYIN